MDKSFLKEFSSLDAKHKKRQRVLLGIGIVLFIVLGVATYQGITILSKKKGSQPTITNPPAKNTRKLSPYSWMTDEEYATSKEYACVKRLDSDRKAGNELPGVTCNGAGEYIGPDGKPITNTTLNGQQPTALASTPDYAALDREYQAKVKAEQEKQKADHAISSALSVVIGLAFESTKYGTTYYGASTIDGTMSFSYIGGKLSSSSSVYFGNTYVSYSGNSVTSVTNSKSGSYYCDDIDGWLSSCSSGTDTKSVSLFDSSPYNAQNTIKHVFSVGGIYFHPYTGGKVSSADSPSIVFTIN